MGMRKANDIPINANCFHLEDVLSCSFDGPCPWSGLEKWKKSFHSIDNSSFLEGKIYACTYTNFLLDPEQFKTQV
jgi:hypothetical protein